MKIISLWLTKYCFKLRALLIVSSRKVVKRRRKLRRKNQWSKNKKEKKAMKEVHQNPKFKSLSHLSTF
jgi:hypothetical protein